MDQADPEVVPQAWTEQAQVYILKEDTSKAATSTDSGIGVFFINFKDFELLL